MFIVNKYVVFIVNHIVLDKAYAGYSVFLQICFNEFLISFNSPVKFPRNEVYHWVNEGSLISTILTFTHTQRNVKRTMYIRSCVVRLTIILKPVVTVWFFLLHMTW